MLQICPIHVYRVVLICILYHITVTYQHRPGAGPVSYHNSYIKHFSTCVVPGAWNSALDVPLVGHHVHNNGMAGLSMDIVPFTVMSTVCNIMTLYCRVT